MAPFIWMLVLAAVAGCLNLLLPFVAYALQLWASTWKWRDRWASLRALAPPGIVLVCCLVVLALLDHAHFWIVPTFVSSGQSFWQAYLPGDLSLSPLDLHALVARLVLLLPLAPGLALLYEYVAPRTRTQPRRILLQADLVVTPIAPPAATPSPGQPTTPTSEPSVAPTPPTAQPAPPPTQKQPPLHRKKQQPGAQSVAGTVEQITIDSFLTPDVKASPASQKPTETKTAKQPSQHSTPPPPKPPDEPIDWDNVLE
jgi:hypothetical protein